MLSTVKETATAEKTTTVKETTTVEITIPVEEASAAKESPVDDIALCQPVPAMTPTADVTSDSAVQEEMPQPQPPHAVVLSEQRFEPYTIPVTAETPVIISTERALATNESNEPFTGARIDETNCASSSSTTVETQQVQQHAGLTSVTDRSAVQSRKTEEKQSSSKSRRNRRRESNSRKDLTKNAVNSKKTEGNSGSVKKRNDGGASTGQLPIVPAGLISDQQRATPIVEINSNYKKNSVCRKDSLQHLRSVLAKILEETQANNLSNELKLASIRATCETELKKAPLDGRVVETKKNFRRRQRKAGSSPKQTTSPSDQQPAQRNEERRYQSTNAPLRSVPQSQSNRGRGIGTHYDQMPKSHRNWEPNGGNGQREVHPNQQRRFFNYYHLDMHPWSNQRPADSFALNKRNRFEAGPFSPSGSNQHSTGSNQHFSFLGGQLVKLSLSSAADSDHPICVSIREEFRRAEDAESLTKLITKAEVHKIQDLADFGRRKLEKLKRNLS